MINIFSLRSPINLLLFTCLALTVLTACKKEDPEPPISPTLEKLIGSWELEVIYLINSPDTVSVEHYNPDSTFFYSFGLNDEYRISQKPSTNFILGQYRFVDGPPDSLYWIENARIKMLNDSQLVLETQENTVILREEWLNRVEE